DPPVPLLDFRIHAAWMALFIGPRVFVEARGRDDERVVVGPCADRIAVISRIARVLGRRADVGRERTPIRPDLAPDALVLQQLQRAPWHVLEGEPAGFEQRAAR